MRIARYESAHAKNNIMQRKKENNKKSINASKFKIAVVVSSFNKDITGKMLEGAKETLNQNKVRAGNVKVVEVPGSFEIPLACQKLAQTKNYKKYK